MFWVPHGKLVIVLDFHDYRLLDFLSYTSFAPLFKTRGSVVETECIFLRSNEAEAGTCICMQCKRNPALADRCTTVKVWNGCEMMYLAFSVLRCHRHLRSLASTPLHKPWRAKLGFAMHKRNPVKEATQGASRTDPPNLTLT